jgi:hypothetical protein
MDVMYSYLTKTITTGITMAAKTSRTPMVMPTARPTFEPPTETKQIRIVN